MDRERIRTADYPRGEFLAAFFHVIWLRGAFVVPRKHPIIPAIKQVCDAPPPPCPPSNLSACRGCTNPVRRLIKCTGALLPDCIHVVSKMAEYIFFRANWNGTIPQCAARCHIIATAPTLEERVEHCMISEEHMAAWCKFEPTERNPQPRPITPGDVDWLQITETGVTLEYKPSSTIVYRNGAALTIAISLLCKLLEPNTPEKLYMDLRIALRSRIFAAPRIEEIYQTICGVILNREYDEIARASSPAWLDQFITWLQTYRTFMTVRNRIRGIESFRSPAAMQFSLTHNHEMRVEETPTGAYVELRWPRDQLSLVEARTTVHVWVRYLGLVIKDDVGVKTIGDTHTSIVLRENDLLRIMRYAPCHLHCARVIELRMPVYKMLCQNYMQVNVDGDVGGARLFIRDFLSLFVTQSIPLNLIGDGFKYMLGCFHGILARFVDTLSLHATKPFLDEYVLKVMPPATSSSNNKPIPLKRYHPCMVIPEDKHERVQGFQNGSNTLYSAILAFFYVSEPHLITVESVRMLFKIFCQNMAFQSTSPGCVHVVNALHQLISTPRQQQIRGTFYIEIPTEMYGLVQDDVPPVAYLYILLVSDLLDSNFAAQMFLSIRLCPRKSKVLTSPKSFKPADMRPCGVAGLQELHREYQTEPPTGMYASLYTAANAPGIGCMHYLAFFMEMQTYTQWQHLHCGDLKTSQQVFGSYGVDPSTALGPETYRGMLTPAHIVRYARQDGRNLQTNTHAYELNENVFQHNVVAVAQFRIKDRDKDISREATEASPLFGCDPFLRACLFTMPIDSLDVEPLRVFQKRKLSEMARSLNNEVEFAHQLKRVRLDSNSNSLYGFPNELFSTQPPFSMQSQITPDK